MDAIEFIKQDHRRIEELFAKFLQTEPEGTEEDLYQQIQTALNAHAEMEERAFYPAVKPFAKEQVEEALKEHAQVKEVLARLLDADVDEEEFEEEFSQLMEDVRHHVEQEEAPGGLLEIARLQLNPSTLQSMGSEIQRIKGNVEEDLAA